MFYNVVSKEYLSLLSFFFFLILTYTWNKSNRGSEGRVQCQYRHNFVTEGLEVVRVQMGKNCVWRAKQQRSTNDIDTTQGTTF